MLTVDIKVISAAVDKARTPSKKRKFTEAVDLGVILQDIDLKSPGSKINELVEFPNPLSKTVKICIIGSGQMVVDAERAGADKVLSKEELEELAKDRDAARNLAREYDFFISEAPLMPTVGKILGSFLGPHGKMPRPVPPNTPIAPIIERQRRMVRVRVKDQPLIQCRVGLQDMETSKIVENIQAVLGVLENKLTKGFRNIRKLYVKSTMGKPFEIQMEMKKR
jgi:large subunit ribosomal protein L1